MTNYKQKGKGKHYKNAPFQIAHQRNV